VVPAPAVSSDELVLALERAGFVACARRGRDVTILRRGLRVVVVSHAPLLREDAVVEILRAAGIGYSAFLDLLSAVPLPPDSQTRVCGSDAEDTEVHVEEARAATRRPCGSG
jgi:hypothetical protein